MMIKTTRGRHSEIQGAGGAGPRTGSCLLIGRRPRRSTGKPPPSSESRFANIKRTWQLAPIHYGGSAGRSWPVGRWAGVLLHTWILPGSIPACSQLLFFNRPRPTTRAPLREPVEAAGHAGARRPRHRSPLGRGPGMGPGRQLRISYCHSTAAPPRPATAQSRLIFSCFFSPSLLAPRSRVIPDR